MYNIYEVTSSTHGRFIAKAASLVRAIAEVRENGRVGYVYDLRGEGERNPDQKIRLTGEV